MDTVNVWAKFEVRSFTRSSDNSGYLNNFGQSLDTPTLPFLHNFECTFESDGHCEFIGKIWSSRCTRSPMLGSARAEALSYSAVKLLSKNYNRCDHST